MRRTDQTSSRFPSRPLLLCSALMAAQLHANAQSSVASGAHSTAYSSATSSDASAPSVITATDSRPAAFELNWSPVKMPTGQKTAFLGAHYMVAINEDWGLGPAAYGA